MKQKIKKFISLLLYYLRKKKYGHITKSSVLNPFAKVYNKKNLYMYEDTNIYGGSVIMNPRAKFVMKKWSGAAEDLRVITGNHMSVVGLSLKQVTDKVKEELDKNHEYDRDVIVDEDVWIGAHVTILSGVHIGRGAEVGTGAVVRGKVPPYAVVIGNPAKVVGFRFTPGEIIHHEKKLYPAEERIPKEILENNYNKYFVSKIKEIKSFTKLSL